jgi:hypothetical protein
MNPYSKICLLSLLIISLVFIYKEILSYLEIHFNNDPLRMKLFDNIDITGWSATHFIVFAIAGYYGHKHIICLMLIGILWEIIEIILGYITKSNKTEDSIWWYGSFSDIIVNFLGLMTGKYVIRKFI